MSDDFPIKIFPKANNWVKYMNSHPCAEPWSVLVETFVPCFLKFAATIYLFDINDIAIERLRQYPGAAAGAPKKRRGKFGATVAVRDAMKGKAFIRRALNPYSRLAMNSTKFLLTVSAPLERIGFIWLVYSATDQFFYDWTSLLQYRNYCGSDAATGPLQRKRDTGAGLFGTTPAALSLPDLLQNRGGWANTQVGATLPANRYFATLSLQAKTNFGTITGAFLRLEVVSAFIVIASADSPKVTINADDWTDIICSFEFDTLLFVSSSISWLMASDSAPVGACDIRNCRVSIFTTSGASK